MAGSSNSLSMLRRCLSSTQYHVGPKARRNIVTRVVIHSYIVDAWYASCRHRPEVYKMDAFREAGVDENQVRRELERLDWSYPLTTADIFAQLPGLPEDLFGDLADGAIFHSPDEVIRALHGEIDLDTADFPVEGAESLGGPSGYSGSNTGRTVVTPSTSHGVGSGTDTGDTGSGNTEATGWSRAGTTFGEEAVEEEVEAELGGQEEPSDVP